MKERHYCHEIKQYHYKRATIYYTTNNCWHSLTIHVKDESKLDKKRHVHGSGRGYPSVMAMEGPTHKLLLVLKDCAIDTLWALHLNNNFDTKHIELRLVCPLERTVPCTSQYQNASHSTDISLSMQSTVTWNKERCTAWL